MKKKEIKNASLRIFNNFPPALISGLQALSAINPAFLPVAALIQSVIGYYGDYATDKTLDLFQDFINNKEKIVSEIVNDDKFKAAFIKIIGDNITEGNEKKRQYLKNYIKNFAFGVEPNFNEHTKLINTLNNITLDEVAVLKTWDEDGMISANTKYNNVGYIFTINDIRRAALDTRKPENNNILGEYEKYIYDLANDKNKANQILLSLGNKDLLYVVSENNFGSGQEAKTRGTTEFGKVFLNFIK